MVNRITHKDTLLIRVVFVLLFAFQQTVSAKNYMTREVFTQLASPPLTRFTMKTLWLNKDIQSQIKKQLDHTYPKLRLRYKISHGAKTALDSTTIWYLEEVGKERPISFGISVQNDRIQFIRVLEFRESRGYEIHIAAFVEQFKQIGLNESGELDQRVDGITGATMSVNAMKKIAKVALLLHKIVISKDKTQKRSLSSNAP